MLAPWQILSCKYFTIFRIKYVQRVCDKNGNVEFLRGKERVDHRSSKLVSCAVLACQRPTHVVFNSTCGKDVGIEL